MLRVSQLNGFGLNPQAVSSGFTPSSITGLQLWLDADLGLTGTSMFSPISTWVAQVGSNATQTLTARPTKNSAAGKTGASFDGANDYLILGSSLSGVPDFTVSGYAYRSLTGSLMITLGNMGGNLPMGPTLFNDGNAYFGPRARYGAKASTVTGWHTFIGIASGSNVYLYIDGVDIGINNNPLTTTNDFNCIGLRGANYGQCIIRSLQYYNKALNSTEIANLHSYLNSL